MGVKRLFPKITFDYNMDVWGPLKNAHSIQALMKKAKTKKATKKTAK